jgi:flagellar hook assembly protein FlgD
MITYQVPTQRSVILAVYDVAGKMIRVLDQGVREAGLYSIRWDGTDDFGRTVASGVYFCRLEMGDVVHTKKIIMVR